MANKPSPHKIAEIVSTGIVALFCGIGAIGMLFQNLIISCLVGTIGIVVGIATLNMQVEKLDKIFAVLGIALSVAPLIYAIVIFI